MAIRRQRVDRKTHLVLDTGRVIDLPPGWTFIFDCQHHGKMKFDFNQFRTNGREDLAQHFRDALWSLRHEMVGKTLLGMYETGLRSFWHFLDELFAEGEKIFRLDQIDRKLLERYLAWMELQVAKAGKNKGQQISIGSKKARFSELKSLLINRQKRVPDAVSPNLSFPRNPFPNSNQLILKREPYSPSEQKLIAAALNTDLHAIHSGKDNSLPPRQVLIVHLIALALATGRNLQSLLDLRRDSLKAHPIEDREMLVTTKRRGWSTHATSVRKAATAPEDTKTIHPIPASIGDYFRFLSEYTEPLMEEAEERDREFIFLWRVVKDEGTSRVVRLRNYDVRNAVCSFVSRHALCDDRKRQLKLSLARLRPTYGSELYQRTRDIRVVQQALGQSCVQTTARHYVTAPLEAERDHAILLSDMVNQFSRMEVEGKVLLAADGMIPLQDMKDLLAGGYNTGIARCRNPFRDNDLVCKKFFACFKCPSMIVFEDDLWRLFSFYYRLLSERSKINPVHWRKTYDPIIRRIDVDIASQFPSDKVDAARRRAIGSPHPTWKEPML